MDHLAKDTDYEFIKNQNCSQIFIAELLFHNN